MTKSKAKGDRAEREICARHAEIGVSAQRVPRSGAAGGLFSGDVEIAGLGRAEVKSRKSGDGFRTLEKWLGGHAALFLRRDRAEPLVVLPWATYEKLLTGGENG